VPNFILPRSKHLYLVAEFLKFILFLFWYFTYCDYLRNLRWELESIFVVPGISAEEEGEKEMNKKCKTKKKANGLLILPPADVLIVTMKKRLVVKT